MSTIVKQQAISELAKAVGKACPDDLAEIYNELFPEAPITEDETKQNPSAVARRIAAHIDGGLEVEEILDLWNVVFPSHRGVWYDEEGDVVHYNEKTEPVA